MGDFQDGDISISMTLTEVCAFRMRIGSLENCLRWGSAFRSAARCLPARWVFNWFRGQYGSSAGNLCLCLKKSAKEPHKLLIVDDHPVFRRGLREIIEEHPRFKIIAEAGDGASGLRLAQELSLIHISEPTRQA